MWLCRSPRMSARLDQRRQAGAAVQRAASQLAAVLAQLRLDVGEAEQLVHLLLARARARPAVASSSTPYSETCSPRRTAAFAQRRVVRARAGEVLQQVAELRGLGDAQVDAHARVRARPRARRAGRADALDLLQPGEALRERRRAGRDGDQVEVLDAVGPPARRAGQLHVRARAALLAQAGDERLADLDRPGQQQARRGPVRRRRRLERRQHAVLELRAQPLHVRRRCAQRRLAQRLERVDAELRVQQPRALGAEAGQAGDRDQAGRELRAQLLRGRDRARLAAAPGSSPAASRRSPAARSRGPRAPAPPPTPMPRAPSWRPSR